MSYVTCDRQHRCFEAWHFTWIKWSHLPGVLLYLYSGCPEKASELSLPGQVTYH